MKKMYQASSPGAKRTVVGISAASMTILTIYVMRDVLQWEMSYEVAGIIGTLIAGTLGWIFSGGLYDLVIGFFQFVNRVKAVRRGGR